jgi:hypothetical protein
MSKEVTEILAEIQSELNAPKNQFNNFGKYNYRSAEDIVEAVKPLLKKHNVALIINDELKLIGERYYVVATAQIRIGEQILSASASAREAKDKKGMDEAQITGAASSYARKYALNGLFAIDDGQDADSDESGHEKPSTNTPKTPPEKPQEPRGGTNGEGKYMAEEYFSGALSAFNSLNNGSKLLLEFLGSQGYVNIYEIPEGEAEKIKKKLQGEYKRLKAIDEEDK